MIGKQKRDSEDSSRTARSLGLGVMIPSMLFACVLVGTGIGYYLDLKFGTKPWLMLFGLIMGSIAGVREMLKILKKIQNDDTK